VAVFAHDGIKSRGEDFAEVIMGWQVVFRGEMLSLLVLLLGHIHVLLPFLFVVLCLFLMAIPAALFMLLLQAIFAPPMQGL
jgi:hypothetical protein